MKTIKFSPLIAALFFLVSIHFPVLADDAGPDKSLWTTKDGISIAAICYTDPKSVHVTDPSVSVVLRFYLANHRNHPVKFICTSDNFGFALKAKGPSDETINYPKPNVPPAIKPITFAPAEMHSFTVAFNAKDATFLKNSSVTATAAILDRTLDSETFVEAPVSFK